MYTIDDIVLSRKEVIKLKRMFRILTGCWDDVPTPIFMERFNKVLPFPVPGAHSGFSLSRLGCSPCLLSSTWVAMGQCLC